MCPPATTLSWPETSVMQRFPVAPSVLLIAVQASGHSGNRLHRDHNLMILKIRFPGLIPYVVRARWQRRKSDR
jgi:hypothetical protein